MITNKELKRLLNYDPDTGVFTVKTKPHGSHKNIGDPIGSIKSNGYVAIVIRGKHYQAHRLAWQYVHGEIKKPYIDHINGIKHDNRMKNLRQCNASENGQNKRKSPSNSKIKLLGARRKKNRNVFESSIKVNGKSHYIGCFKTAEEAHQAYLAKKKELHPFGQI